MRVALLAEAIQKAYCNWKLRVPYELWKTLRTCTFRLT